MIIGLDNKMQCGSKVKSAALKVFVSTKYLSSFFNENKVPVWRKKWDSPTPSLRETQVWPCAVLHVNFESVTQEKMQAYKSTATHPQDPTIPSTHPQDPTIPTHPQDPNIPTHPQDPTIPTDMSSNPYSHTMPPTHGQLYIDCLCLNIEIVHILHWDVD